MAEPDRVRRFLVPVLFLITLPAWPHVEAVAAGSLQCRIILVPGAFDESGGGRGFISAESYFSDYRTYFGSRGCEVQTIHFTSDATIEERALMLKDQVEHFQGDPITRHGPAILIAHSQGGLDARFALQTSGLKGISALVTIGTPHRGTPWADWVVRQREGRTWTAWFLGRVGNYDLSRLRFAAEMTGSFLQRFESRFKSVPGIRYASATGECQSHCHWGLAWLAGWIGVGPGDGLAPSQSQRFGQDLGTFDLDHLSEVNSDSEKHAERLRLLETIANFTLAR